MYEAVHVFSLSITLGSREHVFEIRRETLPPFGEEGGLNFEIVLLYQGKGDNFIFQFLDLKVYLIYFRKV